MSTPGANIPFPNATQDLFAACPSALSFANDGHTQEGSRNASDGQARARVLAVEQASKSASWLGKEKPTRVRPGFFA